MFDFLAIHADKAFLIVLIGIAVAAFIVSRAGEMPAKGWVFFAAAAASVVGWNILKGRRREIIKKEITRLEHDIKQREKVIEKQKEVFEEADHEAVKAQAALIAAKANFEREAALIEAKSQKEREEILSMSGMELRRRAASDL